MSALPRLSLLISALALIFMALLPACGSDAPTAHPASDQPTSAHTHHRANNGKGHSRDACAYGQAPAGADLARNGQRSAGRPLQRTDGPN